MDNDELQQLMNQLLVWPKKIQAMSLNQLAINPIPKTGVEQIDLLADYLHSFNYDTKKYEKKLQAFSKVSAISGWEDAEACARYFLMLVSEELRVSESAVLADKGKIYTPAVECFIGYLNQPITKGHLHQLLDCKSGLQVLNNYNCSTGSPELYQGDFQDATGSHFLFVRVDVLGHILMFHRSIGSPEFSNFDVELVQGLAQYIQLSFENDLLFSEALKAKSDLSKKNRDLLRMTERLERIVEERTKKLSEEKQKAEQARANAEKANKAKSDFLATMSHEFRTPLNGIIGMAQLLETTQPNDEQKKYIDTLKNAGDLLLTLINDILDYAKIESGSMVLDKQRISLLSTANDMEGIFAPMARRKNIEFTVDVDQDAEEAFAGDKMRFYQVLMNLCNNAIKFTEQGRVNVCFCTISKAGDSQKYLYCAVSDTGIGISPENTPKLFKPFVQEDASIPRRFGGTGLGLAITKQLVDLMGGEIGVNSDLGSGSEFWFAIPCQALDSIEPSATSDRALVEHAQRALQTREPTLAGNRRVLVVEDNEINQLTIEAMLGKEGCHCFIAESGSAALMMFKDGPWDLVLMDFQLPDMTGDCVVKKIREIELDAGQLPIPIVALTANTTEDDRDLCIASGMNDFMAKPIKQEALRGCLSKYLGAY